MERGGKIEADGFSHQERKALDQAASVVRTVRPVAREAAGEAQRQVASARLGKGRSLKP